MDGIEQIFQEIARSPVSDEILDIDPNSRVVELDAHWLKIDPKLNIWRFIHEMQESKLSHNDQFRPILLIHGYRSSHVTWNWMVQRFWASGFRNIFGIELLDDKLGLEKNSKHIEDVLHFIFEMLPDIKSIDFIGHSMGGLVARYFVKYSDIRNRVRFLVTLGAAHKGLSFAFDILIRTIGKAKMTSRDLSSRKNGLLAKLNLVFTAEDMNITMVNIGGSLRRYRGTDGFVRPVALNDMINNVVGFKHSMLNKNNDTFTIIYNLITRNVYILKLALIELKFNDLIKPTSFFIQFKIPFNKRKQTYPAENHLLIEPGEEKIKPEFPVVIFGDSILSNQQIILEVRVFKTRFFKNEKISTSRFIISKKASKGLKSIFTINKKNRFNLKLHFNL
ncbi:MAG: lipase family alpha/beta hydrolase, partial [Candidatus Heimdallarchaeota archaeon]